MTRISAIAALAVFLCASPALAGYQDGWTALRAGDWRRAVAEWEPLAEAGQSRALYALGWLYHTSGPPLRDYPKAVRYYENAVGRKHADSALALGMMYQDGLGVWRNTAKALDYLQLAVKFNGGAHRDAEFQLGQIYFKGLGTLQSYGSAIEWHTKAARHDHPASQYILGSIYDAGWGTEPDRALAYYWYALAARHPAAELAKFDSSFNAKDALAKLRPRMQSLEMQRANQMLQALR